MQVKVVIFDEESASDLELLYQRGLQLVDDDSRQRLQRFYHKVDSYRGLIGRLLPRILVKEQRIPLDHVSFGRTETGKPYMSISGGYPTIGYNITHDSGLIAIASLQGPKLYHDPPAYRVGLDAMKLKLPRQATFEELVDMVSEQLTDLERDIVLPSRSSQPLSQAEALRRFYLIWTLKEAYTKALGLGLGFDFKRIEYDVPRGVVRIDGEAPLQWVFVRFEVPSTRRDSQQGLYVGVAATFIEDSETTGKECIVQDGQAGSWLEVVDAVAFLERALEQLA